MLFVSAEVNVPVIGGHAGVTILPLFSQVSSHFLSTQTVVECFISYNCGLALFDSKLFCL